GIEDLDGEDGGVGRGGVVGDGDVESGGDEGGGGRSEFGTRRLGKGDENGGSKEKGERKSCHGSETSEMGTGGDGDLAGEILLGSLSRSGTSSERLGRLGQLEGNGCLTPD